MSKKIKVTVAQKFNALADLMVANGLVTFSVGDESFDVKEFLADRAEKSIKKKSGESKSATENKELAEQVYEYLVGVGKGIRASELIGVVDGIVNTSKATVVLKVLVNDGRVTTNKDKGVSYYSVA